MLSNYKKATKFCMLGPSACEVSWKKPQVGVFKINTNRATVDNGRWLSIGVIIRTLEEMWLLLFVEFSLTASQ